MAKKNKQTRRSPKQDEDPTVHNDGVSSPLADAIKREKETPEYDVKGKFENPFDVLSNLTKIKNDPQERERVKERVENKKRQNLEEHLEEAACLADNEELAAKVEAEKKEIHQHKKKVAAERREEAEKGNFEEVPKIYKVKAEKEKKQIEKQTCSFADPKPCTASVCQKSEDSEDPELKGYCWNHYQKIIKTAKKSPASSSDTGLRTAPQDEVCGYIMTSGNRKGEACPSPGIHNGRCGRHKGKAKIEDEAPECSVKDCGVKQYKEGFCRKHYTKYKIDIVEAKRAEMDRQARTEQKNSSRSSSSSSPDIDFDESAADKNDTYNKMYEEEQRKAGIDQINDSDDDEENLDYEKAYRKFEGFTFTDKKHSGSLDTLRALLNKYNISGEDDNLMQLLRELFKMGFLKNIIYGSESTEYFIWDEQDLYYHKMTLEQAAPHFVKPIITVLKARLIYLSSVIDKVSELEPLLSQTKKLCTQLKNNQGLATRIKPAIPYMADNKRASRMNVCRGTLALPFGHIIDLRTLEIRDRTPADLWTSNYILETHPLGASALEVMTTSKKMTDEFDKGSFAYKFVNTICCENPLILENMRRVIGYSLTGCIDEKCIYVMASAGNNGKSVFFNVLSEILGVSNPIIANGSAAPLTTDVSTGPNPGLIQMLKSRIFLITEMKQEQKLSTTQVKTITGETLIKGLHDKYRGCENIENASHIFIATNTPIQYPIEQSEGDSIRIRELPFYAFFGSSEKVELNNRKIEQGASPYLKCYPLIKGVKDDFTDEDRSELLRWLLVGAYNWYHKEPVDLSKAPRPSAPVEIIHRPFSSYMTDFLAQFVIESGNREIMIKSIDLKNTWVRFIRTTNEKEKREASRYLEDTLRELGVITDLHKNVNHYFGIRLRRPDEIEADSDDSDDSDDE